MTRSAPPATSEGNIKVMLILAKDILFDGDILSVCI